MRKPLLFALCFWGCATLPKTVLRAAPPADAPALERAAEAFFQAASVDGLRQAVADAERAGPDSAVFHELAAELSELEVREALGNAHRLQSLSRTDNAMALMGVHELWEKPASLEQRRLTLSLFEALAKNHADLDVRAAAAHYAARLFHNAGDFAQRDAMLASIPGQLTFAIAGTWDNEQGKGFEQILEPENKPGLNETYDARFGQTGWRQNAPVDPFGNVYLGNAFSPTRWSVAFAQSTFEAPADGSYSLRLTTTDPLKVWVDGKPVFAAALLEREVFEHLQIPLTLQKGAHVILIKSAHREGDWLLGGRVVPCAEAEAVTDVDSAIRARVSAIHSPARRAYYQAVWAQLIAGGNHAVKAADAFVRAFPQSIYARLMLVQALWFNQERGRTADSLAALDKETGDTLPFIRLWQAQFWAQQRLKAKDRAALLALQRARPDIRETYEQLADLYEDENWTEDELATREDMLRLFPPKASGYTRYGSLLARLGRRAEADQAFQHVLESQPFHDDALTRAAERALDETDLRRAIALQQKRIEASPNDLRPHSQLALLYRRLNETEKAKAEYEKMLAICPQSAWAHAQLGSLAYEAKDMPTAVSHWQKSLDLNPDDERLANHLDFVAPASTGPWAQDIPDEADIEHALLMRKQPLPKSTAEIAFLLDHEVILLNSDGSTSRVVTQIQHALNPAGRDRMTRQTMQSAGRQRMLHSYAIDPNGNRTEASSERGRQVFFRNLQVGSTTVLQYRVDAAASGYLARYFTEDWSFQGTNDFRVKSQLSLWMPLNTQLHEDGTGTVERTSSVHGEQMRVQWNASNMAPLSTEPSMPTVRELAANIRLSTVPDWATWLSWEKSLLEGVFRDSPEIEALASQLQSEAPSVDGKLKRIHQYLMEEIRYQQDYESFIAGVKPHPAPMVLERKYGDCKDKAVLFITLAKRMGIDAHFALVRTRDMGPANADVPMQQFNHAIVYVPKQEGYPEGRFFDPTAELLDVEAVRHDDVGTHSLVYDPTTGNHSWRDIPFQAPGVNADDTELKIKLAADGVAKGQLVLKAQGKNGSFFRRLSRNSDLLSQLLQRVSGALLPGSVTQEATAWEVKDLTVPAVVTAETESKTATRKEGDTLRLRVPNDWSPRSLFALATRKQPLVLGTPSQTTFRFSVTLPDGYQPKTLPSSGELKSRCLSFTRKTGFSGQVFQMEQTVQMLCERISAEEYAQYRAQADAISKMQEEELVMMPSKAKTKSPVR
ncbi:MAG: hypothetical protein K1X64_05915 [Myxococcaceae bacterium]|nr:hypothetical protein [Myxococcaceae bacterium]